MKHMKSGEYNRTRRSKKIKFYLSGKGGKNQTNRGREKYLQQLLQSSLLKQSKDNAIIQSTIVPIQNQL